jgi:GR25 family glycosyltransferase involved in LPS biosynthesis
MKAYVIAITDNSESMRMAKRCIRTAKEVSGIDVEVFPAMTPKNRPKEFAKIFNIPTDPFLRNPYSRGENCLSCFLSHFSIWFKAHFEKEQTLIFEHDAVVVDKINTDIPFKGVLSFGKPSYGSFKIPPVKGVNKLVSKQYLPGAHAYMVSPEAADVLISKARKEAEPTDVFINNNRFDFVEEYYPWPVEAHDEFSTVQNSVGIAAKHSFRRSPNRYRLLDV